MPETTVPARICVPWPMRSLAFGDGRVGVALVVLPRDVERTAVDLARAVGRVVEAGLEARGVRLGVGGERTGLRGDHADGDGAALRVGVGAASGGGGRRATDECDGRGGDERRREVLPCTPH